MSRRPSRTVPTPFGLPTAGEPTEPGPPPKRPESTDPWPPPLPKPPTTTTAEADPTPTIASLLHPLDRSPSVPSRVCRASSDGEGFAAHYAPAREPPPSHPELPSATPGIVIEASPSDSALDLSAQHTTKSEIPSAMAPNQHVRKSGGEVAVKRSETSAQADPPSTMPPAPHDDVAPRWTGKTFVRARGVSKPWLLAGVGVGSLAAAITIVLLHELPNENPPRDSAVFSFAPTPLTHAELPAVAKAAPTSTIPIVEPSEPPATASLSDAALAVRHHGGSTSMRASTVKEAAHPTPRTAAPTDTPSKEGPAFETPTEPSPPPIARPIYENPDTNL